MDALRRLRLCNSGSVAIEFAFIAIPLIMVMLGCIEFGRALYLLNRMSHAVDVAERKIFIHKNVLSGELEESIRGSMSGVQPSLLEVTIGAEDVDKVNFRTIKVTYPVMLLVPGIADGAITLSVDRRTPLT